jgi:outer membrane lipoprotein SlyB
MKANCLGRGALSVSVIVCLLTFYASALGQTSQPRPKVVTNNSSSYTHAYQHGYRAGYEDGFAKGKGDFTDDQPRDYGNSDSYRTADRGYSESMGTRLEFQESYRIGFEMGYGDGYFGRPYSITMPTNLAKSVIAAVNAAGGDLAATRPRPADDRDQIAVDRDRQDNREPVQDDRSPRGRRGSGSRFSFRVPDGVEMKVRLSTQIDTKTNREGDRFTAVVLDPSDYAEGIIEGHISKLTKSGKATGKTEMSLAFDSIQMRDGRTGNMAAQVVRVYQSEKVKTVDEEGNVQTDSRTKDTAVRGVGGGALGAIIGGIAGGGKGAAIGAILGAGVGAGSVLVDGGKELTLEPGTEILIRTAAPAREGN